MLQGNSSLLTKAYDVEVVSPIDSMIETGQEVIFLVREAMTAKEKRRLRSNSI